MKILVVGAGFAGAVYARMGAEAGHSVVVIDSKSHIGGTAHDRVLHNMRVHDCGPHLFNTSNMRVVSWLNRFTDWDSYIHKSQSRLPDGQLVPFPLNLESLAALRDLGYETAPTLDPVAPESSVTARRWLQSLTSDAVIEMFFARYVHKMWDLSLDQLPASVVKRVRIRPDLEDRYFPNSKFQALPSDGYTALFERILAHPKISVQLETPYHHTMREAFDLVLCSMPIDLFYNTVHGALPYRSVRFHTERMDVDTSDGCATINRTDTSPVTRAHFWHQITGTAQSPTVTTLEEPCDPKDNHGLRYYPLRTVSGAEDNLLRKYQEMAKFEAKNLKFIGRCGTFQYLNMDQVIAQSLLGAQRVFGQDSASFVRRSEKMS